jgi:hypothetical protein
MAGAIAHGELTARSTSGVQFCIARTEHDAAIRRVLRETAMEGQISVTVEREPSYFAGTNLAGAKDELVLAVERGEVIGMAGCSVRERFVNGVARRVGYLGELRLARAAQGRFDILRRGFQFYAARHENDPADVYFTSIAADNERSIRFLERGLPGMPCYEFLCDFITLLIPTRRTSSRSRALVASHDLAEFAETANVFNERYQLATHWTAERVQSLPGFTVLNDEGGSCAALWDQRFFKQIVVRRYARTLRLFRPLLNAAAGARGDLILPRIGEVLPHALLSPLCVSADEPERLITVIRSAVRFAAERKICVLTLGFSENDPRLGVVRRHFRGREYRTRLYRARWREFPDAIDEWDNRVIASEVALL